MPVPRIVITTGEPAGIGPDVTIAAAQKRWDAELIVAADAELMRERAARLGCTLILTPFDPKRPPQPHTPGELQLVAVASGNAIRPGELNPGNAPYVLDTLRTAVQGCEQGVFDAMVTAPVQKSVINDAGIPFTGHTEFLAELTDTSQVVMMLAADSLRVALATTHLPVKAVPEAINQEGLTRTLEILHADMQRRFGIAQPRIAVLGLNPHAGEDGHLGREEIDTIIPVLEKLRDRGMHLLGPLPADTAFNPKTLEDTDAYLAMFHDQGLPVLKYAGFGKAINITLGLPIIRTSVDHGTALELAGTGRADSGSMEQAIQLAVRLASNIDQLQ